MIKKIKEIFNSNLSLLIVLILAVIFFLATSFFNYSALKHGDIRWSSPDETANYYFSRIYASSGKISVFDEANILGEDSVLPRSFRSDSAWLKPVSFLGLPIIYGSIASFLGIFILPFLTPLFSAIALLFLFLLLRRFLKERVALIAVFIWAVFPVNFYYNARSMFHNVLFLDVFIIGLYFLSLAWFSEKETVFKRFFSFSFSKISFKESAASLLAGIFLGIALSIRTSEIIWIFPAAFLWLIFNYRQISLRRLSYLFLGAVLGVLPVAYYNQVLYGSFWYGGYNEMNRSLAGLAASGTQLLISWTDFNWQSFINFFKDLFDKVFYFGFKPRQSLLFAYAYIGRMFPCLFALAVFGAVILLFRQFRKLSVRHLSVLASWLLASAILIFYYGSWKFNDNPDPNRFTIGNSYTRYWLPVYLGLVVLSSVAIYESTKAIFKMFFSENKRWRRLGAMTLQLLIVFSFAWHYSAFILYGSEESLFNLYYNQRNDEQAVSYAKELLPPEAIVVTRYHDKFFWPDFRVIVASLPDDGVFRIVSRLESEHPFYYFGFYLSPTDVAYLNERRLPGYFLRIEEIKHINSFGLYRFEKILIDQDVKK